jgi:O-antigen/teichoic acid export membrane protein
MHVEKVKSIIRYSFSVALVTGSTMALCLFAFAEPLSSFLETVEFADILRMSAAVIIFNAVTTTQTGILAGFNAFKRIAINNGLSGLLTFVLSTTLTCYFALNGAVLALLFASVFNCAINGLSIRKILRTMPVQCEGGKSLLKELLTFSLPVALQDSLYAIVHWLTITLIIKLSGYGEYGIFTAASHWLAVIIFIPNILKNVTLSHLSGTLDNADIHNRIFRKMLQLNFVSTLIPFVTVLFFSQWICSFYGESFISMKTVLIIVVFSALPHSITNAYSSEFISQGRNWFLFSSRCVRDVLILSLSYLFLSLYPQKGAVMYSLTSCSLYCIYCLFLHFNYKKI